MLRPTLKLIGNARVPFGMDKLTMDVSDIAAGNYLVTRIQNGRALSEIIVIQ